MAILRHFATMLLYQKTPQKKRENPVKDSPRMGRGCGDCAGLQLLGLHECLRCVNGGRGGGKVHRIPRYDAVQAHPRCGGNQHSVLKIAVVNAKSCVTILGLRVKNHKDRQQLLHHLAGLCVHLRLPLEHFSGKEMEICNLLGCETAHVLSSCDGPKNLNAGCRPGLSVLEDVQYNIGVQQELHDVYILSDRASS